MISSTNQLVTYLLTYLLKQNDTASLLLNDLPVVVLLIQRCSSVLTLNYFLFVLECFTTAHSNNHVSIHQSTDSSNSTSLHLTNIYNTHTHTHVYLLQVRLAWLPTGDSPVEETFEHCWCEIVYCLDAFLSPSQLCQEKEKKQ